jgi:hypothetical protein
LSRNRAGHPGGAGGPRYPRQPLGPGRTRRPLRTDQARLDWAKKGLELSVDLKDAMVDAGFMRFFDTPNDPPFLQGFFSDDFDEITFEGLNDDMNARTREREVA